MNHRNANKMFEFEKSGNTKQNSNMIGNFSPPPPYASLFNANNKNPFMLRDITYNNRDATRKNINGRDYMVVKGTDGESRLIPIRAPSAALFQYSYTH